MLVIVISDDSDPGARALVRRLGAQAAFVTPRCLSSPGWTWLPDPRLRSGRAGERCFRISDVTAIVTRLAAVFPAHLPHVATQDRDFIAAEMTAFFRAWLAGLPCPVFNKPTNLCLTGPAWNREQWAVLAKRLDIPAVPIIRRVSPHRLAKAGETAFDTRSACRVVIAGCHHSISVGVCAPVLIRRAEMIAEAAGTPLLAVDFDASDSSGRLLDANCWPDLTELGVLEAVVASVVSGSSDSLT